MHVLPPVPPEGDSDQHLITRYPTRRYPYLPTAVLTPPFHR